MNINIALRTATLQDTDEITTLIALSARALAKNDYTPEEIEAALTNAWGLDTALIKDQTYFVAITDNHKLAGCGGWSKRNTVFGSDAVKGRNNTLLNPLQDAARIRAFFIHPDYARQGIGKTILKHCEDEARAAGFKKAQLMATLPGQRLYAACGYQGDEIYRFESTPGIYLTFKPMYKDL